jgi:hypothetical protein
MAEHPDFVRRADDILLTAIDLTHGYIVPRANTAMVRYPDPPRPAAADTAQSPEQHERCRALIKRFAAIVAELSALQDDQHMVLRTLKHDVRNTLIRRESTLTAIRPNKRARVQGDDEVQEASSSQPTVRDGPFSSQPQLESWQLAVGPYSSQPSRGVVPAAGGDSDDDEGGQETSTPTPTPVSKGKGKGKAVSRIMCPLLLADALTNTASRLVYEAEDSEDDGSDNEENALDLPGSPTPIEEAKSGSK